MTTKEKIVRQAISKVKKEIENIKSIVYANPLGRICEIRIECQKILHKHGYDHATILRLIEPLGKEEKKCLHWPKNRKIPLA